MSRIEQRNVVILVAVIVGLLVGVGVLANYTGILRADVNQQSQPKVGCSAKVGTCGSAEATTCGLAGATAGGCSDKKAAEWGHGCQDKAAGCSHELSSRGCDKPHAGGCCAAETEGAI